MLNSKEFSKWPLEMGGEEIHGENTYHKELSELAGGKLIKRRCKHDYITYLGNIFKNILINRRYNPAEVDENNSGEGIQLH